MMQHTTLTNTTISKKIAAFAAAAFAAMLIAIMAFSPTAYGVTAAEKQAEAEEALANLNAMQETLDRLSAEYGQAVYEQQQAEESRDAAEKRIAEVNAELEQVQGRLNERAREMYRSDGISFLEILLGANTFEEFAMGFDMVSKVNQSDADMIDRQRVLRAEAEEQAAVYDEQAQIASEKAAEAENAAAQAQATVAEMQSTYDNLSAEAAELLEEERRAREAEEAARAAAIVAASAAQAEQSNGGGDGSDGGGGGSSYDAGSDTTPAVTEAGGVYEGGSDTVSRAQACLGAPYVWGGVGPGGYDCSGLVSYCLSGEHIRLGTTYTFMDWPTASDPQPGDIAVNWSHTGVYIGGGQMIHAATYGVGVIIGPVQDGMKIVRYPG